MAAEVTGALVGGLVVISAAGYAWDQVRRGRRRPASRRAGDARGRYYRDAREATFGEDQSSSGLGGGPGW